MSGYYVWPRLDRSNAESRFAQVSNSAGPGFEKDQTKFDISPVGTRMGPAQLQELRDELLDIAEPFGFNHRHGYDQEVLLTEEPSKAFDLAFTEKFRSLTPMRWAEAGSREVWSWFALVFLPDLTHWRWKQAVIKKKGGRTGEWNSERWVGIDLTRHTWARYWWRNLQFENNPRLLGQLKEHEFNHILERKDSIGSNQDLITLFGQSIVNLQAEFGDRPGLTRKDIVTAPAKLLRQRMAFVDHTSLEPAELEQLVSDFMEETRMALEAKSTGGQLRLDKSE